MSARRSTVRKRGACAFHPSREAHLRCHGCSRWLCDRCATVLLGEVYCSRSCQLKELRHRATKASLRVLLLRVTAPWAILVTTVAAAGLIWTLGALVAQLITVGDQPSYQAVEGTLLIDGPGARLRGRLIADDGESPAGQAIPTNPTESSSARWRLEVAGPPDRDVLVVVNGAPHQLLRLGPNGRGSAGQLILDRERPEIDLVLLPARRTVIAAEADAAADRPPDETSGAIADPGSMLAERDEAAGTGLDTGSAGPGTSSPQADSGARLGSALRDAYDWMLALATAGSESNGSTRPDSAPSESGGAPATAPETVRHGPSGPGTDPTTNAASGRGVDQAEATISDRGSTTPTPPDRTEAASAAEPRAEEESRGGPGRGKQPKQKAPDENSASQGSDGSDNNDRLPQAQTSRRASPPILHLVPDAGSRLALTFDGGSSSNGTSDLLDLLNQLGLRVTMFLTGEFIERDAALVRRALAEGHEIANHTWDHPRLTTYARNQRHSLLPHVSRQWFESQLQRPERAFFEATGQRMAPYWRAPFGEESPQLRRWALELGYLHVRWSSVRGASLDSWDWVDDEHSALYQDSGRMMERLLRFPRLEGGISLMHLASDRPRPPWSSLPELVRRLRERGIEPVTVTELLEASRIWRPWARKARANHLTVWGPAPTPTPTRPWLGTASTRQSPKDQEEEQDT